MGELVESEVTMVLPSDASMDRYPDNKVSAFTVHLNRDLIFPPGCRA